jgi:hypothetical protein
MGISAEEHRRDFRKIPGFGQFNLEEPTVTRLFKGLKKEGLDFGDPLQVDEAIRSIKTHWDEIKKKE